MSFQCLSYGTPKWQGYIWEQGRGGHSQSHSYVIRLGLRFRKGYIREQDRGEITYFMMPSLFNHVIKQQPNPTNMVILHHCRVIPLKSILIILTPFIYHSDVIRLGLQFWRAYIREQDIGAHSHSHSNAIPMSFSFSF